MGAVKDSPATATARPRAVAGVLAHREVSAGLLLAGILGLAYVAWFIAGRRIPAPWIMGDELLYSDMAKSFHASGHYEFRDIPYDLKTIYPAIVSPAWSFQSISSAYGAAKAINVALMTAAAIPAYFWARRLVGLPLAFLAVALIVLMPSYVYSAEIMTENAFLPAFMLAAFLLALTLERPTLLNQALTLGAIGLAVSVRLQGAILVAIVPAAIGLKLLLDLLAERPPARLRYLWEHIRSLWLLLGAVVLGGLAYAAYEAHAGRSLTSGLGAYQAVGTVNYTLHETARWAVYHLAELSFAVGVIPACALIVLVGLSVRRGWSTPAERALLAITLAAVPLVCIQVGAFASRFSFRIEERNMFFLEPLLLLAFVVWLGRGAPRPQGLTTVAAIVPVGLLVILPLETLFGVQLTSDTFGLIPLYRLSTDISGGATDTRILFGLGAVVAGILFAVAPKRMALPVLGGAVIGFLLLSSLAVLGMARRQSFGTRAVAAAADPEWVDHAVGYDAKVGYVNTQTLENPHILWQTEFWNRSVGPVMNVGAPQATLGDTTTLDQANGRLTPVDASSQRDTVVKYVVADANLNIAGRLLGETPKLKLWQIQSPLRIATYPQGIDADGWTSSSAGVTEYAAPGDRPGRIAVKLDRSLGPAATPATVTVTLGPFVLGPNGEQSMSRVTAQKTVTVTTEHPVIVRLPTPKPPYRVNMNVTPTFDAALLGQGDTRQLGARVALTQLKR